MPVPQETDYIGIYLTTRCFLSCPYCITNQHDTYINSPRMPELSPGEWIRGLNRLRLPAGIPLTFQGGEPFLYRGIWELLDAVHHKIDILTALPPAVTPDKFRELKTLDWNKRPSPYPTIRVSFHPGQNDYKELIDRISELQTLVSIGLYHIEHPEHAALTDEIRALARSKGVEFRTKAFLGTWKGTLYGEYRYKDAAVGQRSGRNVLCRNTVFPVGPDGRIFRCHADLYAGNGKGVVGHILDADLRLSHEYRPCDQYGLCSSCDVKIKTNHLQEYGYTSIDVLFEET